MRIGTILSDKGKDYFFILHLSKNGQRREELWNYAKNRNVIGLDSLSRTHALQTGDIILAINGWDSLLGVAEISKPMREPDTNISRTRQFFAYTREVNWIKAYEYHDRQALPRPLKGFNGAISMITSNSSRWAMLTNLHI